VPFTLNIRKITTGLYRNPLCACISMFIHVQELNKQGIFARVALNNVESDKRVLIDPASEGDN